MLSHILVDLVCAGWLSHFFGLSDSIGLLYLLTECSSGYNWNILKYIQLTEEDPLVSHTHFELLFKFLNFKSLCLSTESSDWTSNWQCVNDGLIYQSIWDVAWVCTSLAHHFL
jgi:hypothetical protein